MILRWSMGTAAPLLSASGTWESGAVIGITGQQNIVGTNGATWYITGVQLEKGSVATPFEYRPIGTELALCQRYYERWTASAGNGDIAFMAQAIGSNMAVGGPFYMKVTKRTTSPTITYSSNSHFNFTNANNSNNQTGSLDSSIVNANTFRVLGTSIAASPLVAGNASSIAANTSSAYIEMSAEL